MSYYLKIFYIRYTLKTPMNFNLVFMLKYTTMFTYEVKFQNIRELNFRFNRV